MPFYYLYYGSNIHNYMNSHYKKLIKETVVLLFSVIATIQVAVADDELWKSGKNLYIKLDDQDKSSQGDTKPNQHPVELAADQVINALKAIKIYDKKEKYKPVFSTQQATLLGKYLVRGLAKAEPGQDIVFALAKRTSSYAVIKETYFMAGRAFYVDDKLNIIIGDYDRLPDKFMERVYSGTGDTQGLQYFFEHGKRGKPSKFKHRTVKTEGITSKRKDWFVVDVTGASDAYIAALKRERGPTTQEVVDTAIQEEAEKLAKERREMRLEMARMRKEMREAGNNTENNLTIEERLVKLDELHEKKLISDSEYEQKRQEILNDI